MGVGYLTSATMERRDFIIHFFSRIFNGTYMLGKILPVFQDHYDFSQGLWLCGNLKHHILMKNKTKFQIPRKVNSTLPFPVHANNIMKLVDKEYPQDIYFTKHQHFDLSLGIIVPK